MAVKSDWFDNYKKLTTSFKPFQVAEEAKRCCRGLEKHSEAYYVALSQWVSLSLVEAQKARNPKEAKAAFENSPDKSKAQTLARDKWDEFSVVEARRASRIEEAKAVYVMARPGVKAQDVALARWSELWYKQVEEIKTVEQYKAALKQIPWPYRDRDTSSHKEFVLARWNRLVLPIAKRVKSYKKACAVYELCPPNSEAQKLAMQKVNSLFTGERTHGESALYLMDRTVIEFRDGEERASISTWGKLMKRLGKAGKMQE